MQSLSSVEKSTHVYLLKGKPTPLGATYEGPHPIKEKLGTSCLKVEVGVYNDGTPREDVIHWNNAKPGVLRPGTKNAQRPALGRPKAS